MRARFCSVTESYPLHPPSPLLLENVSCLILSSSFRRVKQWGTVALQKRHWFISAFGVATSSVHNFLSCHYSAIVSSVEWCLVLPHPVCLALARVLSAETQEKSFLKKQTFLEGFFFWFIVWYFCSWGIFHLMISIKAFCKSWLFSFLGSLRVFWENFFAYLMVETYYLTAQSKLA